MKDHGIKQLANPAGDQDAVNLTSMKKYVGKNSIMAGHSHKKNVFAYLNSGDVTAVNNVTSVHFRVLPPTFTLSEELSLLIS